MQFGCGIDCTPGLMTAVGVLSQQQQQNKTARSDAIEIRERNPRAPD
jgi:hypothetical protein